VMDPIICQDKVQKSYSEETAKLIDEEVRKLVDQGNATALHIIAEKKKIKFS